MSSLSLMRDSLEVRLVVPTAGVVRQTVELIVSLCLCILFVRTFSAEAYVVPTGSMAPTLLGLHREIICPNCGFTFVVGIDEEHHTGEAVCPNCGQRSLDRASSTECGGDRVLVEKFLYDFRAPKRWEVAVFHFPGEPSQAYVFIDGKIVRKSLAEIRAMRILVHDSRFQPQDAGRFPRWQFRAGSRHSDAETGWALQSGQFAYKSPPSESRMGIDWLVYKHWDPSRGRYGPVRDFYAYNGGDLGADNDVDDLGVDARVRVSEGVDVVLLALRSGSDQFVVRVPVGKRGSIELTRNGQRKTLTNRWNPFEEIGLWPRSVNLTAAVFDHRLQVAIDGRLLFDPYDYDDPVALGLASESPFALGARGGAIEVNDLRIYRDIYYTSSLANTPRYSRGMATDVKLGKDEYFVLGDNSPVSNDSRFWNEGPVVRASMFVGRPFLVHLPGQVVAVNVFGRSVCWVPDPRQIRYIR
jgi:signal peptidase I